MNGLNIEKSDIKSDQMLNDQISDQTLKDQIMLNTVRVSLMIFSLCFYKKISTSDK